ncbi:MAG: hypothetical protein ACTH93_05220 [Pseudoclavibacter sp.]
MRGVIRFLGRNSRVAFILAVFVVVPLIIFVVDPTVWRLFVLWVSTELLVWGWFLIKSGGVHLVKGGRHRRPLSGV